MVVLSSFCSPESPVKQELPNVAVFLDKKDYGTGRLYISERTLCWKGADEIGFSLGYPHITLHAVCKDPLVCSSECVYIMIDTHVNMPGCTSTQNDANVDDSSDNESDADISELLLVPESPSLVNVMYQALMECQALNPDPEDMSDEDEEDNIFEDAEDEGIGDVGGGGDADMEHITNRMSSNSIQLNYECNNGDNQPDEQFEDAD